MQPNRSTSHAVRKMTLVLCYDVMIYIIKFLLDDGRALKNLACVDYTWSLAVKPYLLAVVVLAEKDTAENFCEWVEGKCRERNWVKKLQLVVPKDAKAKWLSLAMKRLGKELSTLRQLIIVLAPEGSEDTSVFRRQQVAEIVEALGNFSPLLQLRLEGLRLPHAIFTSTLRRLPSLELLDLIRCRFCVEGALRPQTVLPISQFRFVECLDSRDMFMTWFSASCDPRKMRSVTLQINYRESMGSVNQFLHSIGPHLKHLDLISRHADEPFSFRELPIGYLQARPFPLIHAVIFTELLQEIKLDNNTGLKSLKLNRIEDMILLNLDSQLASSSLHTLTLVTPHSALENLPKLNDHFVRAGYDRLRSIRFVYDGPLDRHEVLARIQCALPSIQANIFSVDQIGPPPKKIRPSFRRKLLRWAKKVRSVVSQYFFRA